MLIALLCVGQGTVGCASTPKQTVPPEALFALDGLAQVGEMAEDAPYVRQPYRARVLTFMASWCFPCLTLMSELATFQRRWAECGVGVEAIGMDREGALTLEPYVEDAAIPFPVLLHDVTLERLGIHPTVLPTTLLIDADGAVVEAFSGATTLADLESRAEELLGGPPGHGECGT